MIAVEATFYEAVGGHPTFQRLVEVFYAEVADDGPLRALYPEADLGPAADRLRMFLEQYWGGPTTYSDQRGHPRLRLRHAPYAVTHDARVRWLTHMRTAVDTVVSEGLLPPAAEPVLWDYLQRAALSMVNTFDEQAAGGPS